jgi:toxin FitB
VSFLLDTNVVTELRKGPRIHPGVATWIASVDDAALHLSVLVAGELRSGVERLRPRDPASAERLDRWLQPLLETHADRILPVSLAVADLWGRLNSRAPLPVVDGLLAATALVHDLVLVTRNVRDLERTGVKLLDPFSF